MSERPAALTAAIAVVGSLNLDLVVRVPKLPGPGETVSGGDVFSNPGGKGANQAVAAARLGRAVAMVGCVGDDQAGRDLLASLAADGVDTTRVRVVDGVPSGTAFITVNEDGENQIVVSPGTNARLTPDDVRAAGALLEAAAVTLIQLETPMETVAAAARTATGTVVLNPAPAQAVPEDLLGAVDVLVPNRVELAQLTGAPVPSTVEEAAGLAARLPARAVVVTLGADGCLVVESGRDAAHVPAVPVRPVDTTAAGDAFCAGLADALAGGAALEDAARWGARVAAAACTRLGAQASLPTAAEVP